MRIHRIVDYTFAGGVNLYLVEAEVPFLVDAGTGMDSKAIIEKIKQNTEVVDSIILTHGHFDHSGAMEISKHFKAPVYVHRSDSRFVECDHRLIEEFEFLGFRIIETPGHSPGSICLYYEETGDLICGDLIFANGSVGRWDLPYGSFEKLKNSIAKISKLNARNLYPGHGYPALGDGKEVILRALNFLRKLELEKSFKPKNG